MKVIEAWEIYCDFCNDVFADRRLRRRAHRRPPRPCERRPPLSAIAATAMCMSITSSTASSPCSSSARSTSPSAALRLAQRPRLPLRRQRRRRPRRVRPPAPLRRRVYWAAAGRQSLDAALVTTTATLMLLLGVAAGRRRCRPPRGSAGSRPRSSPSTSWPWSSPCSKASACLPPVGVFVPLVAPLAALTLARPNSPWARWLYRHQPTKLKNSCRRRAQQLDAWGGRLRDAIAGTTEPRPR